MLFLNPYSIEELRQIKQALLTAQGVSQANGVEKYQDLIVKTGQVIMELRQSEMEAIKGEINEVE